MFRACRKKDYCKSNLNLTFVFGYTLFLEAATEGAFKIFTKFRVKHLSQNLFFDKVVGTELQLYKKETLAQVFSYELCEIFKNTFFT